MKTYKEVSRIERLEDKTICDICKREKSGDEDWCNTNTVQRDLDWIERYVSYGTTSCYERLTIEHYTNFSTYPGEGTVVEFKVDICACCFREKLVPFLQSFNPDLNYKTTDH